MPKHKTHKGLLKRIRITKSGEVRHKPAGSGHLKSAKTSKRLRTLRGTKTVSNSDAKRFSKLLFRRLRGRDQPKSAIRRSPAPGQDS